MNENERLDKIIKDCEPDDQYTGTSGINGALLYEFMFCERIDPIKPIDKKTPIPDSEMKWFENVRD